MESSLHIPVLRPDERQAETNASYTHNNPCRYYDDMPTVLANHQAHCNSNIHVPRSSTLLPRRGPDHINLDVVAVEQKAMFSSEDSDRTQFRLLMEPDSASSSDTGFSGSSPLRNSSVQEQGAYMPCSKPLLAYAPDSVQGRQTHHEQSQNHEPPTDIQILAPVPLSFSARSKDVLYSMISDSSKLSPSDASPSCPQHSQYSHEAEQDAMGYTNNLGCGANSVSPVSTNVSTDGPRLLASCDNIFSFHTSAMASTYGGNVTQPDDPQAHILHCPPKHAPSRPIKSISPATLIALSEPFLMDWCIDPEWTSMPPPRTDYDEDLMTTILQSHYTTNISNSWGY